MTHTNDMEYPIRIAPIVVSREKGGMAAPGPEAEDIELRVNEEEEE